MTEKLPRAVATSVPAPTSPANINEVLNAERKALQLGKFEQPLFGLAFSGGGIRSAALNLGVLQALAKKEMLGSVKYISAISGGGYILGWFAAWIRRAPGHFAEVAERLKSGSQTGSTATSFQEPDPVHFLRNYTSYLTPRVGLASGDTLAMISIYLRNLLLNQAIFASVLICLAALVQMIAPAVMWSEMQRHPASIIPISVCLFVCILVSAFFIGRSLGCLARNQKPSEKQYAKYLSVNFAFAAAVCAWLVLPDIVYDFVWLRGAGCWVVALGAATVGFRSFHKKKDGNAEDISEVGEVIVHGIERRRSEIWKGTVLAFAGSTAFVASSLIGMKLWLTEVRQGAGDSYAVLGLPALLFTIVIASYIFIGLFGTSFPDAEREWLGRHAGWLMYVAGCCAGILGIALMGPTCMQWLFGLGQKGSAPGWLKIVLPGGWLFTVISGVLAAKSQRTSKSDGNGGLNTKLADVALNKLASITPAVFFMGILLLASWGTHGIARSNAREYLKTREYLTTGVWKQNTSELQVAFYRPQNPSEAEGLVSPDGREVNSTPVLVQKAPAAHFTVLRPKYIFDAKALASSSDRGRDQSPLLILMIIAGVAVLIASLLLCRIDINEFSMHLFYRNRLVRAFLGASAPERKHSPFTGFSHDDEFPLTELIPSAKYDGPYPIWGTALNITDGKELAWQKRKAASFIYSPLYCGWHCAPGDSSARAYRYTGTYTHPGGPNVGGAMATSGAAISPNWGYHTKSSVAALLAIFNLRVGRWTGNPRDDEKESWQLYAPRPWYLVKELMGYTDASSEYVYLSDGGHFENLGIYELVRRRVKYIIACDADADASYTFGDLGNAIEKCRRDFGVEIKFERSFAQDLRPSEQSDGFRHSDRHYAVARIIYEPERPEENGLLLYLKSSLTGDESADVTAQHFENPCFPHDTTLNQCFDETKFEAYRCLGEHILDGTLGDLSTTNWAKLSQHSSRLGNEVREMMKAMRSPNLADFELVGEYIGE